MAGIGWADIADDLIYVLAKRMVGMVTLIRFSAVCKSWYSIASTMKCANPIAWLMLAEKEASDLRDFYDHSTGELYQISLPHAHGAKVVGSSHGWLIVTNSSEGDSFFLINPLSGTQIALPFTSDFPCSFLRKHYLTPEERRDCFIIRATCSPINPNGDYVVAASHMGKSDWFLSYRKSTDKEWSCIELHAAKSVAFVGGVLFMVTRYGALFQININADTSNVVEIDRVPLHGGLYHMEHQCYVVDCAGEILVVSKIYTNTSPMWTRYFQVFRLDRKINRLILVPDLGDYALFLGSSFSVATLVTPLMMKMNKFEKNCIYFIDDQNEQSHLREMECGCDLGVFHCEDGSITPHYPGEVINSSPSMPMWVMPSWA